MLCLSVAAVTSVSAETGTKHLKKKSAGPSSKASNPSAKRAKKGKFKTRASARKAKKRRRPKRIQPRFGKKVECPKDVSDMSKTELYFDGKCRTAEWIQKNLVPKGETLQFAMTYERSKASSRGSVVTVVTGKNSLEQHLIRFRDRASPSKKRSAKTIKKRFEKKKYRRRACRGGKNRRYVKLYEERIQVSRWEKTSEVMVTRKHRKCRDDGRLMSKWNVTRNIWHTSTTWSRCVGKQYPPACPKVLANSAGGLSGEPYCREVGRISAEMKETACLRIVNAIKRIPQAAGAASEHLRYASLSQKHFTRFMDSLVTELNKRGPKDCKVIGEDYGAAVTATCGMSPVACSGGEKGGGQCERFRDDGTGCKRCKGTTDAVTCACLDVNGNDIAEGGGDECSKIGVSQASCDKNEEPDVPLDDDKVEVQPDH